MIIESKLPHKWVVTSLESLIVYVIGGDWGKAADDVSRDFSTVYCIRGSEFRDWSSNKGNTAPLRVVKKTSLLNRQLQENDILVEISGGGPEQPVGRTVLIDKACMSYHPEVPKIPTNFLRLTRPSSRISARYLNYFLGYFYRSGEVVNYQAGSNNLRNLKFNDYIRIDIPLAPIKEQHRIVAKIEELFSELDKGIESLKTAHEQLKVYRQALLKHAFEGKLTEQWRKDNADKLETAEQLIERIKKEREARYQRQLEEWGATVEKWEVGGKKGKKPVRPKKLKILNSIEQETLEELSALPENWIWEKLGWMTTGVEYGTSAKSQIKGSHPVLRMGNIKNTKFDWNDLVYTNDPTEIDKYLLRVGDVLFNRTNSPELVGKTAIYTEATQAVFAGYLIRVNQIRDIVVSQYLNLFLNSHVAKQHGNAVKTDGVNQSNINGEKLNNYPFPFCSIAEQHKIVEILDEKLSVVDAYLSDIVTSLARSEALRQSILKRAFAGQLVSQNPDDESASVLLARIVKEKEALAAKAKKAREKTSTGKNKPKTIKSRTRKTS